jgi:hypothetical protein
MASYATGARRAVTQPVPPDPAYSDLDRDPTGDAGDDDRTGHHADEFDGSHGRRVARVSIDRASAATR